MHGDTGATARDSFGSAFLPRPSPAAAAPWPRGAKALLWAGLALASWAPAILAGYFVWSAL